MFSCSENLLLKDFSVITGKAQVREGCLAVSLDREYALDEVTKNNIVLGFTSRGEYKWNDTQYLVVDMCGIADSKINLTVNFFKQGEQIFSLNYSIIGKRRVKTCFHLAYLDCHAVFLPTLPGHLKGHASGFPTTIDNADEIRLCFERGRNLEEINIYSVRITDKIPDLSIHGMPLVDKLGQWKDKEWEGKFHDEHELIAFLKSEYESALECEGYSNPYWDKYGGWKKLKFEAKGFFYITKKDGRNWLVTPDGNAFFSNGVCYASRMGVHGFIDKMEPLFDWLPSPDDPTFKDAYTTADCIPEFVKRNGEEAGRSRKMFNFARANMIRAFGADGWWDAWVKINSARMKKWGFNTISVCVNNYTDENMVEYLRKAEIPFCYTLKKFPKTKYLIFRDFPDVFSPEYDALCAEFAMQMKPFAGNPYFIGCFINNEPEWMFARDVNPAERLLASSVECASKTALVEFLKSRYNRDISAFNTAWKTDFNSFDDLYTPLERADLLSEASAADLSDFRDILIGRYSEIPAKAIEKVVPNTIILGMRYGGMRDGDFSGVEMFDAFSFNCYSRNPSEPFGIVRRNTSHPFIIGEWHYGGSDTGLMSNALVNATTQTERGKACVAYMQKVFEQKNCIGAHYFEFNDQPLLGRFDGENMQHGLIDVCNRPHYECVKAFADFNYDLYERITGIIPPSEITWQYHYRY